MEELRILIILTVGWYTDNHGWSTRLAYASTAYDTGELAWALRR